MTVSDTPEPKALDAETRLAVVTAVDAAKARGWTQADLRGWFEANSVTLADYIDVKAGRPVRDQARHAFAAVSITGLPDAPQTAEDPCPDIPDQMKSARRWLLWKLEPHADLTKKPRKVPYYVTGDRRSGGLDTVEDTDRLADYTTACAALDGIYAGLGFALGNDGTGQHWQGIDLDHLDQHPGLQFIVDDLPGYTERSPSGAGVHAIGYGRAFTSLGSNTTGIEAYAGGRYFTVTGESTGMGEIGCLADFVERRLTPLHGHRPQDTSAPAEQAGRLAGALAYADLRSALASMRADDRDLWVRMGLALKELGDTGRGLWLEWSQSSDKYDAQDAAKTWESLRPERTGYQAVFAEAQRGGWVNPASVHSASVAPAPTVREVIDPETGEVTTVIDEQPRLFNLRAWGASAYQGAAPDIVWLCDGTIPLAIPVLFASMGGLGKSFIAIDAALMVALEVTSSIAPRPVFGGAVVQTGTAVILSAEDSKDSIHRRLEAIDPEGRRHQCGDRLIIVPMPNQCGPQTLIGHDGKSFVLTDAFRALKAELLEIPDLKLLIIDPLQAFVMADVNADPAAGQFMWSAFASLCAETGATVIVPHHMRKEGAASIKTADEAREAIRGSTALVDGARLAYALWKASETDARNMCARLDVDYAPERIAFGAVVKANDKADRSVQTYVRRDSGLLVDQSDRVATSSAPKGVSVAQAQELVNEIGRAFEGALQGHGEGYAVSAQSGERQAWKLVMKRTGCAQAEAKTLVEDWVMNGVLQTETVNKKTHKNALKKVGNIG